MPDYGAFVGKPKKKKNKETEGQHVPFQKRPSILIVEALIVLVAIAGVIHFFTSSDEETVAPGEFFTASDYYERAQLRFDQRDYEAALEDYTRAIANNYDPVVFAYFGRARTYNRLNRPEDAIADYTRSIELDVDCRYNCQYDHNNRSLLYRDMGRLEDALSDLNIALSIDENYTRARRNRGQIHEMMGNEFLALQDWNRAISEMQSDVIERGIDASGGERRGRLPGDGTHIHYQIPARAGTLITARITEADFDSVLLIRASDGTPLAYNDNISTTNRLSEIVDLAVPIDDTYTIIVAAYLAETSGDFTLNVRVQTRQPARDADATSDLINTATVERLMLDATLPRSGRRGHIWSANAGALYESITGGGVDRLDLLLDSGSRRTIIDLNNTYDPLAISPDERLLAVAQGSTALVYTTGYEDGVRIVNRDGTNRNISERVAILRDDDSNSSITALAFDSEVGLLAIGRINGDLTVWDAVTWQIVHRFDNDAGAINHLAFLPGEPHLVSTHSRGNLQIWDTASFSRRAYRSAHETSISGLSISDDGLTLATNGVEGSIRLWDSRTLTLLVELPAIDARSVTLAFSPDGTMVASGDLRGTIRVWDVLSRTLLTTVSPSGQAIRSLAWRDDMSALYSTNDDGVIHIWRIGRADE